MSTVESFKKLVAIKADGHHPRDATQVVAGASLPAEGPSPGMVYLRVLYCAANATDLNAIRTVENDVPKEFGVEGLGEVVQVHVDDTMADGIAVGTTVVFLSVGAFAEFVAVPRAVCQVVDRAAPEYLALNVSGLTAAIALGELAGPALTAATPKKKVALVTAAAGGTGHLAVQLLKEVYHCTVVGTCSSPAKAHYLRDTLRCDHVIDYQTALAEGTLDRQLGEVAPEGFTVIYECVGGELFNTAVRHIAPRGVVLMIGAIVHYATGGPAVWQHPQNIPLSTLLLTKSASLKGFHLSQFTTEARQYGPQLMKLLNEKRIRVEVDAHALDTFHGIDQVIDAVEYIHSGRSMGKVMVKVVA